MDGVEDLALFGAPGGGDEEVFGAVSGQAVDDEVGAADFQARDDEVGVFFLGEDVEVCFAVVGGQVSLG